jgi:hypothetical protein
MDNEIRKQIQLEIMEAFTKHNVTSLIEIVGLLEVTKTLAILSGSSKGLGAILEKQAMEKAGLVEK